MDRQKHFAKIQMMKNIQSKIKPIKFGKQPGRAYCLGCKDQRRILDQKKKKTNKIPREKCQCVVCRLNK